MAPSRLSAKPWRGETTHRVSAIADAGRSLTSSCLSRYIHFGHWLRAAGRCVVMSGLSSVLKGVANAKLSEWGYCSCKRRIRCTVAIRWYHRRHKQRGRDSAVAQRCLEAVAVLRVFAPDAA